MPNTNLVSPYETLTTTRIYSAAVRHIRLTSFNKWFSVVVLQTDFLRVWVDNLEGLKPVCAYNRWDQKGTLLNAKDSRKSRGIPKGGLRPKSAYNRGDYRRTLLYNFSPNFRSGTPARRQVTLENCVYSGQGGGMIYIERDWTQKQCYNDK